MREQRGLNSVELIFFTYRYFFHRSVYTSEGVQVCEDNKLALSHDKCAVGGIAPTLLRNITYFYSPCLQNAKRVSLGKPEEAKKLISLKSSIHNRLKYSGKLLGRARNPIFRVGIPMLDLAAHGGQRL